ncbi:MAG: phosphoenolpyruvate--protein phosphotransferase [Gemmataceae bacterium]
MNRGVAISPGVAVARAYRIDETLARHDPAILDAAALSAEVNRFEQACGAAGAELDAIIERVSRQVGEAEASIFRAHRQQLRDPSLIGKITSLILDQKLDARTALKRALEDYTAMFERIADSYLRERLADLRDVIQRIDAQLAAEIPVSLQENESVILVVPEILPSHAVMFGRVHVAGILTELGGPTGHAAILARSLGIPAVSGVKGVCTLVHTGDLVALDGREGVVHIRPGAEVEAAYRKLQREYFDLRDRLVENRDQEAVTRDGEHVELLANINNAADAASAGQVGAVGVGLYRTEYLFLTHPSVPTEEEQFAAYRAAIEAAPNRAVTIRTLDLGGDKMVPYIARFHEANPFMGWRSVRLSSAYPEFFQTQLRAIVRAAATGDVKVLFPMISTVEELRQLKLMLARARDELARRRQEHAGEIPVGVMIEVPAAAICIDDLLDEVDFVSLGTNDLIQYVMAADRDNPKVAHLCEPFSPAIFRLIHRVITPCLRRNKPVTVCGEMAGRPRCVLPLFAMGLRSFSMSPAFVPTTKQVIRSIDQRTAREILDLVLPMRTIAEVKTYLTQAVRQLCPDVAFLDTFE